MSTYESTASVMPIEDKEAATEKKKGNTIRSLIAYWVLGLCNNYGYVVMLTAAADIIGETSEVRL